jgi:predicted RNase H-like nuclease (RuvC/YqgF family)
VEAALICQIEELGNKLTEKDSDNKKLEANFHGRIKELEKKLQEKDADKEQLETNVSK